MQINTSDANIAVASNCRTLPESDLCQKLHRTLAEPAFHHRSGSFTFEVITRLRDWFPKGVSDVVIRDLLLNSGRPGWSNSIKGDFMS